MISGYCNICGGALFDWKRHVCPPRYRVRELLDDGNESEYSLIFATNGPAAAAESYADYNDAASADYGLLGSKTMVVEVVDAGDVTHVYKVHGKLVPVYKAEEIR